MSTINQKEYLKNIWESEKFLVRKEKEEGKNVGNRMTIIDDDVDILISQEIQQDISAANEDAPQIVAVIDERPPSLRIDEQTRSNLWKPIGEPNNITSETKALKLSAGFKLNKPTKSHSLSDIRYPQKRNNYSDVKEKIKINEDLSQRSDEDDRLLLKGKNQSKFSIKGIDINSSSSRRSISNDNSPLRRENRDSNPSLKRRYEDDSSPPRRRISSEDSPCKRKADDDYSPPRRQSKTSNSPSRRKDGEKDNSPPRRKRRNDDPSLERKSREAKFSSKRWDKEEDSSPPRKRNQEDLSPPRRNNPSDDFSPLRKNKDANDRQRTDFEKSSKSEMKMKKTLDGKKAGLQSAKELFKETVSLRKQEDQFFENMSAEVSGRNAATVIRGKKDKDVEEEARQLRKEKETKEKYDRWGKGLKQVEDQNDKIAEQLHEMSKPLARYADDKDLEKYLKEQEREGDPMLEYIRKKKRKDAVTAGIPEKPTYKGEFMPNRFGICPGYRWDGVDRSNGYEKKWFQVQNSRKATQEEAFKWSTEDM